MARPKGLSKTGGRKRGTPNKATAAKAAAVAASGLTPLDYLLGVMRDEKVTRDQRMEAAGKAAPFVHPKLAAVDMRHDLAASVTLSKTVDRPPEETREEWLARRRRELGQSTATAKANGGQASD